MTTPHATDQDEAQQEHTTRVILVMMGSVLSIFTFIIIVGWGFQAFPLEAVVIMLLITSPVAAGWWLVHRGHWRLGGYIPPHSALAAGPDHRRGLALVKGEEMHPNAGPKLVQVQPGIRPYRVWSELLPSEQA